MSWNRSLPSTSFAAQREMRESINCFLQDLEEEKKAATTKAQKARKLENVVLKRNYYRIYRRTCEINENSKTYKFGSIETALQIKETEQFYRLIGVYRYDGKHWLYYHVIKQMELEDPSKIQLNIESIESCPPIDSYTEVFGKVLTDLEPNILSVHMMRNIPEGVFEERKKQLSAICKLRHISI